MRKGRAAIAIAVGGVLLLAVAAYFANDRVVSDSDEQASAQPAPIRVRVLQPGTFAAAHEYAPYYVVPRKRFRDPQQLSRVARNKLITQPESALQKGALAGSPQIVRLELRATSDEPVTVQDVRFTVVSSARALRGWYTAATACDAEGVPRALANLDRRRPRTLYRDAAGDATRAPGIEVTRGGGDAVLELQASTRRKRVAWTAELVVRTGDDEPQMLTVDDDGEPFRVTSERSSRSYRPIYGASGVIGFGRQSGFGDC